MNLDFIRERISTQNSLLLFYHKVVGFLAALRCGFPGKKLKVIGVTGTNGKTTTCNLIAKIFEEAGRKIGLATSINFRIAGEERVNDTKQTTQGRFALQRFLKDAVNAGCEVAVLEVTSHALMQSRLFGVPIHTAVLTNITADHIEYHGSLEGYRSAKLRLFQNNPEVSVLPLDDPSFPLFEKLPAKKKVTYQLGSGDVHAHEISYAPARTTFTMHHETKKTNEKIEIELSLPGELNVKNSLAAASVALAWKIPLETIKSALQKIKGLPGRYESIEAGQPFSVIVDYAHTPDALEHLCKFYRPLTHGKLIIVFGATGGGRDKAKRPVMGEIVSRYCDIVIVTDDDPYEENRQEIIDQVARGVKHKILSHTLFKIIGRKEAMKKAFSLAGHGDAVIIAGKGCEPIQMIGRGKIPWDDRTVARELIALIRSQKNAVLLP